MQNTSSSTRSARRGAGLVAMLGLVGFALVGLVSPAQAATFSIATADGTLFPGQVTITGTTSAGATVSAAGADCAVDDATETFSCTLALADGEHTLRVTETLTGVTSEATVDVRVLGAPGLTTGTLTNGTLSGSGLPGSGILLSGDLTESCGVVQSNGFWSCVLAAGSGTYSVALTQTWGGNASEPGATSPPITLTVDKDAPPLPAVDSPAAGSRVTSQPTTFSGSGVDGSRVDLFVDGTKLCSSPVSGSRWSCQASLANGLRTIQAIQWDAVENASGATAAFTITAGAAATVPSAPGGTPGGTPPSQPEPSASATPAPVVTSTPSPAPTAPFLPPPVGGQAGVPPAETWGMPTGYGAAIPAVTSAPWALGVGLGLAFLALVAWPLHLLAGIVRRRPPRAPVPAADRVLGPRAAVALAITGTALLAALAGGLQGEARYARLILAVAIAVGLLNAAVAGLARLVGGVRREPFGLRILPALLVAAGITAVISRVGGIQPPLVIGVIVVAAFPAAAGDAIRVIGSAAIVGTSAVLGVAAWIGQSLLGPVEGFGPVLASETLAALAIAGSGSAVVLALPVGALPGSALFAWSPPAWAGMVAASATLAAVIIAGGVTFPVPWALGVALGFGACAVAAWAWVTHLRPMLGART